MTAPELDSVWRGRPVAVWLLMALVGLLGVTALAGGTQFVLVPSGDFVGVSTAELAGSPFDDFLVPGLVLFTVLGVYPLLVLYGLYRRHRLAWLATISVGIALAVWVAVEGLVIGFGERMQFPHLVQAIVIVVLAAMSPVREHYGFG